MEAELGNYFSGTESQIDFKPECKFKSVVSRSIEYDMDHEESLFEQGSPKISLSESLCWSGLEAMKVQEGPLHNVVMWMPSKGDRIIRTL